MAFVMTLAFATEHDREDFVARALPRTRAHQVDLPEGEASEDDGMHRLAVAVTSPSAARDLCHQIVAFLAHAKNTRVDMRWSGVDSEPQVGEVNAGAAREAEILAMRVGAAAKAHLDAERAGESAPPAAAQPEAEAEPPAAPAKE